MKGGGRRKGSVKERDNLLFVGNGRNSIQRIVDGLHRKRLRDFGFRQERIGEIQQRALVPLGSEIFNDGRMNTSHQRNRRVGIDYGSQTARMQKRLLTRDENRSVRSTDELDGRVRTTLREKRDTLFKLVGGMTSSQKDEEEIEFGRILRHIGGCGGSNLFLTPLS